jgi:hypothetical protein
LDGVPAENKWCEPAGALAANFRAVTFSMIHEFQRIIPVETPVGYGSLLYVESAGPLSNDIFAVVLEDGGQIRHFRSDQLTVLENPTMDIVGKQT